MSDTRVQAEGVLVTEPFPYQSVEEKAEVYLARFQPDTPLKTEMVAVTEVYLNFGETLPDLHDGDKVKVAGELVERKMVTRSGKIRRGGVFQILVETLERR